MSKPIRVVVTGASGHLGSHLVPELVKEGFDVTGTDIVEPAVPAGAWRFERVDLTDSGRLAEVLRGADAVIHCASIHPWKKYADEQYLDNNIKGTWQLYQAAVALGIGKVVLTSSIAAIGYQNVPPEAWPVREDAQFPISDLYSVTKHAQEDIARCFAHTGRVQTLALRPPAFFPLPPLRTGIGLTANFALVEDIAAAHVAALKAITGLHVPPEPLRPFEAFTVTNELPYQPEDASLLGPGKKNGRLIQKYWPEAHAWLSEQGCPETTLLALFDLSKAKRLLNWRPTRNFEQWYVENRR
jgi:nucleoside-diphosphate-sugar epimerase